jgi:hypothetical protein
MRHQKSAAYSSKHRFSFIRKSHRITHHGLSHHVSRSKYGPAYQPNTGSSLPRDGINILSVMLK